MLLLLLLLGSSSFIGHNSKGALFSQVSFNLSLLALEGVLEIGESLEVEIGGES